MRPLLGISLLSACVLSACSQLIDSGEATYGITESSASFVIESSRSRVGDNFGSAIALEGDQLIVVAPTADLTAARSAAEATCGSIIDANDAGRIHAFQLHEKDGDELAELKRTSAASGEGFVTSTGLISLPRVSVARSERMTVVGIPGADHSACVAGQGAGVTAGTTAGTTAKQAGKAYVFELDDDEQWQVTAVLTEREPAAAQFFGSNVVVRGELIFVAAPGDRASQELEQSGAVYVFARDGATFREQQRLEPSNPIALAQFGSALSVDGDTLAVGAWFDSHAERGINAPAETDQVVESGAAYVFRERDGHWEQEAYIKAFNRGTGDLFGLSIALQDDMLLVAAPVEAGSHPTTRVRSTRDLEDLDRDDAEGSGAVYAYTRDSDGWHFDSYIKAFKPRGRMAFGVGMSFDAGRLLVGAPYQATTDTETGEELTDVGAAYLYERVAGAFAPVTSFHPEVTHRETLFGYAADLEGDTAVIGAPESTLGKGMVSVFDLRDLHGE